MSRHRPQQPDDLALLQRQPLGADRRERARTRCLRGAGVHGAGQRPHHGAADYAGRPAQRLGAAHHRGDPVLLLRPLGQEGRSAHFHRRAADRRPAAHRRRPPRADDGLARGAGTRLLQHSRGSPDGHPDRRRPHRQHLRHGQRRGGGKRRRRRQARRPVRNPRRSAARDHRQAPRQRHRSAPRPMSSATSSARTPSSSRTKSPPAAPWRRPPVR